LVTLRGSYKIVVRDITDISNPRTIGTLGPYTPPSGDSEAMEGAAGQFVCQQEMAYLIHKEQELTDDDGLTYWELTSYIYRAPISGSPRVTAITTKTGILVFAWSRDGSTLLYVAPPPPDGSSDGLELHELRGGVDRVIASMPFTGEGGCEAYPCPGPFQDPGDKWDFRLSYSPDERYISVVFGGIDAFMRVWTSAGKLVGHSDDPALNMSVWSGPNLYFRDSKGVEVWHNGTVSSFLPGVFWIRPKASPAGGQILYETRDAKRVTHVSIVDTAARSVTELAARRSEPAYLTSQVIWYQAEPSCELKGELAGGCAAGFPRISDGSTYIYSLTTGTESSSVITSVIDEWPRGT
jgi:hypothetical protein